MLVSANVQPYRIWWFWLLCLEIFES